MSDLKTWAEESLGGDRNVVWRRDAELAMRVILAMCDEAEDWLDTSTPGELFDAGTIAASREIIAAGQRELDRG